MFPYIESRFFALFYITDISTVFLLKELHFFTFDFRQQEICQTAGSQTEQSVVQPFFAQHFFYDGVVDERIVYAVDASCRFETYLVARQGMVFLNSLTHYIGCFRSGGRLLFAGGSLDEIGSGIHG